MTKGNGEAEVGRLAPRYCFLCEAAGLRNSNVLRKMLVGDAHGANSHPCEVAPRCPVRGATVLGVWAEHKSS